MTPGVPPPSDLAPAPFIVGVPRSGTTLLRLQLDAHPELALPAETGFGAVARRFEGSAVTRDGLLDALTGLPTWADLAMSREALGDLLAAVEDWNLSAGLRAFYRGYAEAHGKARYGDKTPGHASDMAVLARVLPEARFVHIIRDGRDVAASLRGLPFAPGDRGIAAIAAHWRDTVWRARRAAANLPYYTEVRYEALVNEPERVLRDLCDFLELEFAPEMLRAHERARERLAEFRSVTFGPDGVARLPDGTEVVARTHTPPRADRVGRWRHALSEHDVTRFERFAGGALVQNGYRPYEQGSARSDPVRAGRWYKLAHESRARQAVARHPRRHRDLRSHGGTRARAARARCHAGGGGVRRCGRHGEWPRDSRGAPRRGTERV